MGVVNLFKILCSAVEESDSNVDTTAARGFKQPEAGELRIGGLWDLPRVRPLQKERWFETARETRRASRALIRGGDP